MELLIRDMLIWLVCFSLAAFVLVGGARLLLRRRRARIADRLQQMEQRYLQRQQGLTLPPDWQLPALETEPEFRVLSLGRTFVCVLLIVVGAAWSMWHPAGWSWPPLILGVLTAGACFLLHQQWLQSEIKARVPARPREFARSLERMAVAVTGGQTPSQAWSTEALRVPPETSEQSGWMRSCAQALSEPEACRTLLQRSGPTLAPVLERVLLGGTSDPAGELRALADQLEAWNQGQTLQRTKQVDGWIKAPLACCLIPAVNLAVFGPAVTLLLTQMGQIQPTRGQRSIPVESVPAELTPAPEVPGPDSAARGIPVETSAAQS